MCPNIHDDAGLLRKRCFQSPGGRIWLSMGVEPVTPTMSSSGSERFFLLVTTAFLQPENASLIKICYRIPQYFAVFGTIAPGPGCVGLHDGIISLFCGTFFMLML